jgi:hypothetical protein
MVEDWEAGGSVDGSAAIVTRRGRRGRMSVGDERQGVRMLLLAPPHGMSLPPHDA